MQFQEILDLYVPMCLCLWTHFWVSHYFCVEKEKQFLCYIGSPKDTDVVLQAFRESWKLSNLSQTLHSQRLLTVESAINRAIPMTLCVYGCVCVFRTCSSFHVSLLFRTFVFISSTEQNSLEGHLAQNTYLCLFFGSCLSHV